MQRFKSSFTPKRPAPSMGPLGVVRRWARCRSQLRLGPEVPSKAEVSNEVKPAINVASIG